MKNKLVTYLLIGAVIFLWGLIIYRVVDATGGTDDVPVPEHTPALRKKLTEDDANHQDTLHLLLNYRDPFAIDEKREPKEIPVNDLVGKVPVINNVVPHVTKPMMNWNFITYSGYIRNSRSKRLLAIVTINGREYMMAEGDTDGEVKLLKNLKDSIKVSFQGKSRFVAMNTK